MPWEAQKRLLRYFFCIRPIPENSVGRPQHLILALANHLVEGTAQGAGKVEHELRRLHSL
jgi:hypothetical protein